MLTLIVLSSLVFLYTGGRTFSTALADTYPGTPRFHRRAAYLFEVVLLLTVPIFIDITLSDVDSRRASPDKWILAFITILGTYGFTLTPKLAVIETVLRRHATKHIIKGKRAPLWLRYAFLINTWFQFANGRTYAYVRNYSDAPKCNRADLKTVAERIKFFFSESGRSDQIYGDFNDLSADAENTVRWLYGGLPPAQFHFNTPARGALVFSLPAWLFELGNKLGYKRTSIWHALFFSSPLAVALLIYILPEELAMAVGSSLMFIIGLDVSKVLRRKPFVLSMDVWGMVEYRLLHRINLAFMPVPIVAKDNKGESSHWDFYSFISIPDIDHPLDRLNPGLGDQDLQDADEHISRVVTLAVIGDTMVVGTSPLTVGHCMIAQMIALSHCEYYSAASESFMGFGTNKGQYVNRHDAATIVLQRDPRLVTLRDKDDPHYLFSIRTRNGLNRSECSSLERLYSEHLM